ncbi:hypothetical protein B0I35DRAFT_513526 [Stachybotrys elegans]|uniref:Uncharacterized protein n=1 Tax=Stachybotrys elegans TaxID=80388 RepID=A0A8K0WPE8_9HYPO|nr:hypothetical protein B0I35DRAFT_513526 [Stachybotrys elegans]
MGQTDLACEHCGEVFQRREHRDRHLLRHTGVKPFQCPVCSKSFSRSDTLLRHRAVHDSHQYPSRSLGRRANHACLPCAKLKQRCDGGLPCSRCLLRAKECTYVAPRLAEETTSFPADASALGPLGATPSPQRHLTLPAPSTVPQPDIIDVGPIPTVDAALLSLSTVQGPSSWYTPGSSTSTGFLFDGGIGPHADAWNNLSLSWNPMMNAFPFQSRIDTPERPFYGIANHHDPSRSSAVAVTPSASWNGTPPSVVVDGQDASAARESYLSPENICSRYKRVCRPFPEAQADSLQTARAEMFGHIDTIPDQAYEGLCAFYWTQRRDSESPIIPRGVLHSFAELYVEYFDPQFPFLHLSRLRAPDLPWILLLATAAMGSQYSEGPDAAKYSSALCDLLARAIETAINSRARKTDVVLIQSTFLLLALWMFSVSHRETITQQSMRSTLSALCWDLLSQIGKQRYAESTEPAPEINWQDWLAAEEEIRIITCVRVFECLEFLFVDTEPIFHLRECMRQLPCSDRLWQCQSSQLWEKHRPSVSAQRSHTNPDTQRPEIGQELGDFASKVLLLELFVDQKNESRRSYSSQLLWSSFTPHLTGKPQDQQELVSFQPASTDTSKDKNSALDAAIEHMAFLTLDKMSSSATGRTETLFHVLAILRRVPLEALNSATGWRTSRDHMSKTKLKLRVLFHQNGVLARKCLWHAVCIFRKTRATRLMGCYDVFALMVATTYIYCYGVLRISAPTTQTPAAAEGVDAESEHARRPAVVRLDQLHDRSSIEQWFVDGGDTLVHLTGVGLLDGPDHSIRFLRDIEKTLSSQIAWRGFCHAFATWFAQLRRGEMPAKDAVHEEDSE